MRALRKGIGRFQKRLEQLQRLSYRWSWIRLAVFAAGLLASGLAWRFFGLWALGIGLVLTGVLFGAAVYYHRQVEKGITRHQVWLDIKASQVARMNLDWDNIPLLTRHYPGADHPFERDLDLVGRGSLHHLLDTSASHEGSQRLRDWLTDPAPDAEKISQRQQLVRELTPLRLFRDKFRLNAVVAAEGNKAWDTWQLARWLEDGHTLPLLLWLRVAVALASVNLLLFGLNRLSLIPPIWLLTFLLYVGFVLVNFGAGQAAYQQAVEVQAILQQFGAVFRQLETCSYRNAPRLKSLCAPFLDPQHRPSVYLARLVRAAAALGLRGNWLLWFSVNVLAPWDFYFLYRLDQCKREMARRLPRWMELWVELDALNALADFAYLNPAYTFPHILADKAQAHPIVFHAQGLGHPLIPAGQKIRNDFALSGLGEIAIITGSNMAGKSVFLKTVGANLALAYGGGPVNAQQLETRLLRLFTCIQISDSLADGISYFYAEVKRLQRLLSEAEREHPLPLFFFIDEIFRGTNNRERIIGSRAFVSALAGKAGVGLIATHDLELAKLAEQVPTIKNYHFGDEFVDGRLVFDYTLQPGPCPTTNALKIMALEGLIASEP